MTGPAVPDNATLIALATDQDVEGDEIGTIAQGVVDFVTAGQTALNNALAELSRTGLPDDQRQSISDKLTSAKGKFDSAESVLNALIAPAPPSAKARKRK